MTTSPFGLPPIGLSAIAEQFGLVLLDAFLRHGVALAVLLALELLHRLDQHFGVGEQVFADALAERRLVGVEGRPVAAASRPGLARADDASRAPAATRPAQMTRRTERIVLISKATGSCPAAC